MATPTPEASPGLGLGFGTSRSSISDALGRMSVATTATTASVQGPQGGGKVVPIVTVQAPSTEDGVSLLSSEVSSEVGPMERVESPDEEDLFYHGGPRGFGTGSK